MRKKADGKCVDIADKIAMCKVRSALYWYKEKESNSDRDEIFEGDIIGFLRDNDGTR